MRTKLFFIVLFCFVLISGTYAKETDRSTAEKVAVNFYYEKSNQFNQSINLESIEIQNTSIVENAYWIVNLNHGWVLVSADDVMTPVIGYNFSNSFPSEENQDYNLKSWMQNFIDQVDFINKNKLIQSEGIANEWARYTSNDFSILNIRNINGQVDPLLPCEWNQDNPYNLLCPEDEAGPGGHVYVGCVATAMIQIMYYWRYPNQGSGSHSYYEYPYGTLTANFGEAEYKWDAMQGNIDPANPWEIAEIGYHAAVSVEMGFGPNGSGSYSWDVPYAMRNYFNYHNSVQYVEKSDYSFSTWETMIQDQLNAGQPCYYSGFSNDGGHAFVFDGYQGSNYYHINLGWSGSGNGFYSLQDVAGFNSGQGMVWKIFPDDPDYPYFADGLYELTEFSGSFTDGSGPVEDYPSGTNASWLINPQTDIDSISNITLHFKEFNTASSDKLSIYAGNSTSDELLGEFSGDDLPSTISYDGNQMLITFNSNGTGEGFMVEYKATTPTWCNGSQSYTDPSGIISDGSEDFYYSNSTTCVYVIQNPEAVNITLEFTEFNTEQGKDKVQVYNATNQLLGEFSGNNLPNIISEETNMMILVWSTNSTVRGQGWEAFYTIDGVGYSNHDLFNDIAVYPNPTDNYLNLDFSIEKAGSIEIYLRNITGQTIYTESLSNFSGQYNRSINLTSHPKGIYLLTVLSDKGKYDRKIVLK
jgi:hypothetical protein